MERLTERNKNSLAMAACCGKSCEYNYVCEVGGFGECRGMDDIIDRLADFEDILGDEYDLDRLRCIVEADKNGMFAAVPCKVGDTVYVITNKDGCLCCGKEIVKCEVNTMRVKSDGITIGYSCRGKYGNGNNYIGNFVFKSIGKTVFLTREAAEEALKGER